MKEDRVLVGLVVLDALLVFTFIGTELIFQQTLPSPLRSYVGSSDGGWPSLRDLVTLQLWALTALATLVAWVGLLNFWRFARPLYLVAWAAYLLLVASSGPQVLTAAGAMLQLLDGVVGGAILGLVYFSDLKRRYQPASRPSPWREPVAHAVSVVCALVGLGLLLGAGATHAAQRYTVPGGKVAVYNLAGKMQVVAGRSADVEVEVSAQGDDGAKLTVKSGPIGDHQALRVIYPDDHIVYRDGRGNSSTSQHVHSDGTFGGDGWGDGHKVTVSTSGSGLEAWADLTVYVPKGKQVAVHLAVGDASVANVDGDLTVDVHAARVRSEHTRGRLRLDTGSGGVDVLDAQGDVSIDTGSGGAHVSGVRGDRLIVDTGSGGVTGDEIEVDRLSVDTGSGGVELGSIKATDIHLDTGSGHVTIGLLSDVRSMDIDTGSGGVTITVPETLGAEADIEVGSGGIDIDVPHEIMGKVSRDHYRCKIGDGQGRIHIDTGSGGVRLKRG